MRVKLETKTILTGLVLMIFGVLVILLSYVVPNLVELIIGLGFIVAGILQILPSGTRKT